MTKHFITGLLTLLVLFLIALNWKQSKTKEKEYSKEINELVHTRDSIESELSSLRQQRDILVRSIDSVNSNNQSLLTVNQKLSRELKSVKGRYNQVSQDSLGKLMDSRASGTNR